MNKKVKFKFVLSFIVFLSCIPVSALELAFTLTPQLAFPFLTKGLDKYDSSGYGGFLDAGVTPLDYLTAGTSAGFFVIPKQSSSKFPSDQPKNVVFVPLGLRVGTQFYPFSRLELTAGLSGGFSLAITGNESHEQPWYKVDAGAAFRINPSFSIGLNVSWTDFQYNSWFKNPLMQGLTVGISLTYRYDTKKSSGSVSASVDYDDNVFPLLYTVYKENSFGTLTISNDETAEIRNVRVSVRAEGYTASELECGHISSLPKHKALSLPLMADFSEAILQFTENGQIPAEVVINYELLGQKRTSVSQIIIPVYNRNQMRWADPAVIASYVSPSSQEVMEFSKALVGVARRYLRSGLNRNMQFAMYLFEGMRTSGIQYQYDSTTPYDTYHLDTSALDYLQYPYQTMQYRSGDVDDIGILLMSLLQSVGIETSFIASKDDFLVLFNTEIAASNASSYFDGYGHIIILEDDYVWIPLSMKAIGEGFINSWYKGIAEVNEVTDSEDDYYFVGISDAWTYYTPAGFTSGENVSLTSSEKTVSDTVETDIVRYITAEFGPQITAIQNKIKAQGASASLYNQLGMLYVRAGMYSNAIPVFELAVKMGSVTAMNNLGNLASMQKKYEEAAAWYRKVLELEPENQSAKANLNRVMSELEN